MSSDSGNDSKTSSAPSNKSGKTSAMKAAAAKRHRSNSITVTIYKKAAMENAAEANYSSSEETIYSEQG